MSLSTPHLLPRGQYVCRPLFVTSAFASDVNVYITGTEPDADGTCSPSCLCTRAISVHEDDGWDPTSTTTYYLNMDLAVCEPMPGLESSDRGPQRSYADGSYAWRIDLGTVNEGEYSTMLFVPYPDENSTGDFPVAAEPWACGACDIPADIDGDGVDHQRLPRLFTAMGKTVRADDPRDVTGDGVDGQDLVELVYSLGDACPEGLYRGRGWRAPSGVAGQRLASLAALMRRHALRCHPGFRVDD